MRVCAVSLPELRIELVREERGVASDRLPLAVVVAPAPMTEAKLLGNTRLSVVSREARSLGVLPGHTIAQARARAGDLTVRVVRPDAVRDVLARIAEVGLAFGATVSFGMEGEGESAAAVAAKTSALPGQSRTGHRVMARAQEETKTAKAAKAKAKPAGFGDVVWIDVTGCAHLHAPSNAHSLFDGETILASRLAGVIASMGHACTIAIADGPRVAAMLAQHAAESAARAALTVRARKAHGPTGLPIFEPIVIRPGENAHALASLPLAVLPLPPEDVRWLAKLGVRTIHELRALPRSGLGTRLGARARDVLGLIDGEDRAPLAPYVPPEVPEEEVVLEYGVEGTQALAFVAKTLSDRLAARLQGRAVAAARVELELQLDAAMLPSEPRHDTPRGGTESEGSPERRSSIELVVLDLPAPLSSASDLLAALRPKIERLSLRAPVLRAKLRAPALVHKRAAALALFEAQPKAERALPRLVAELVSDLGPDAVSSLVLGDSWEPEDRSRLVAFGSSTAAKAKPRRRMLSSVPEPTRLLAEPLHISRDEVRVTRHLSRLESIEWWKTAPTPREAAGARRSVDYVQAWTEDGAAWIEIHRATGGMRVLGWFD